MSVFCELRSLLAIWAFAVTFSSAHVIEQRVNSPNPGPASSFDVDLVYITPTKEFSAEAYAIPVTVGDTEMHLHLDSGNDASWVLSDLLPEDQYRGKIKYPARGKPRCPAPAIGFEDGVKIEGQLVTDMVKVKGVGFEQQFVAAERITPEDPLCLHSVIAGNIGFAYGSKSWITLAYRRGVIKSVFAFALGLAGTPKATISLDPKEVSEDVTWFDREEEEPEFPVYQWTIVPDEDDPYLFDAGASIIYQPDYIARDYHENAHFTKVEELEDAKDPNKRFWRVGCSEKMPDFKMKIGKLDITIDGADLKGGGSEKDKGMCVSKLLGYDISFDEDDLDKSQYLTLGIPFFKNTNVYFDMAGKGRIGIKAT